MSRNAGERDPAAPLRRQRIIEASHARVQSDEAKQRLMAAVAILEELLVPGEVIVVKILEAELVARATNTPPPPSDWIHITRSSALVQTAIERPA